MEEGSAMRDAVFKPEFYICLFFVGAAIFAVWHSFHQVAAKPVRKSKKRAGRIASVDKWLKEIGLKEYGQSFADQGFDDVEILSSLSLQEIDGVVVSTGMLGGHALKLRRHILGKAGDADPAHQVITDARAAAEAARDAAEACKSAVAKLLAHPRQQPKATAARATSSASAKASSPSKPAPAPSPPKVEKSAPTASAPEIDVVAKNDAKAARVAKAAPAPASASRSAPDPGEPTSSRTLKQSPIPMGSRVQVHGLTGKPEHNGALGEVQQYDASKERFALRLDSGVTLSIKKSNFRVFNREPKDEDIPEEFLCCITKEMMKQPVITSDGHTYERSAITEWLQRHSTSPKTGQQLPDSTLRPNHSLRAQIIRFREQQALEPLAAWEPEPQEVVQRAQRVETPAQQPQQQAVQVVVNQQHPQQHIAPHAFRQPLMVALTQLPQLAAEVSRRLSPQQRTPLTTADLVNGCIQNPQLLQMVFHAVDRVPELQQMFRAAVPGAVQGNPTLPAEPPIVALIRAGAIRAVEELLSANQDWSAVQSSLGDTLLHVAAWEGQKDITRMLLAKNMNPAGLSRNRSTPLHFAVWQDHDEVAELLIQAKVGIEQRVDHGDTALVQAAYQGSIKCIKLLVARKADLNSAKHDGDTALHLAAQRKQSEALSLLVEAKADVNAANRLRATPLKVACFCCFADGVKVLLKAGADINAAAVDGETPLHAICHHRPEPAQAIVEMLLAHKASVTATRMDDGFTPLHIAAGHNYFDTLELLMEVGHSSVNLQTGDRRLTPLHVAVMSHREGSINALLNARADPGIANSLGLTPLHMSLMEPKLLPARVPGPLHTPPDVARAGRASFLLLNANADCNAQGQDGMAPVHVASTQNQNGHVALAVLVQHKANLDQRNAAEDTALHLAARAGSIQIVELLLNAKCDSTAVNKAGFTAEQIARQENHSLTASMIARQTRGEQPSPSSEPQVVV